MAARRKSAEEQPAEVEAVVEESEAPAVEEQPAEVVQQATARTETFEVKHDGDTFVVTRNVDTGDQSVEKK